MRTVISAYTAKIDNRPFESLIRSLRQHAKNTVIGAMAAMKASVGLSRQKSYRVFQLIPK